MVHPPEPGPGAGPPPPHALVIKTSSLGDVIHTLPALTDAARALPGIRFDWVVEESLAEIPRWHPAVDRIIPVALRRWRKSWWGSDTRRERAAFTRSLRERSYTTVIEAQGLVKSAWIAFRSRGTRHGLAWGSAREPLASLALQRRHSIPRGEHAIQRVRSLFALALGYPLPDAPPDYGIDPGRFPAPGQAGRSVVFLHGTTWATKHWPEPYWIRLAALAGTAGYRVLLPWGSDAERDRAQRIAAACPQATVLERMKLDAIAGILAKADGVVAVDTGLAHVAAALGTPTVTLYGATRPGLTGTVGENQVQMDSRFPCAPCLRRTCQYRGVSTVQPACLEELGPEPVWTALERVVART